MLLHMAIVEKEDVVAESPVSRVQHNIPAEDDATGIASIYYVGNTDDGDGDDKKTTAAVRK